MLGLGQPLAVKSDQHTRWTAYSDVASLLYGEAIGGIYHGLRLAAAREAGHIRSGDIVAVLAGTGGRSTDMLRLAQVP